MIMDSSQIYTTEINAAVVAITAAVVQRLSASQGTCGTRNRLATTETTRFRINMAAVWFLFVFLYSGFEVFQFIVAESPIERVDIALLCLNMLFMFAAMTAIAFCVGFLQSYRRDGQ